MLEMFVFWLSYGVLSFIWWAVILSVIVGFIDKYIERITGGDIKGTLCHKFVAPLWDKLGLLDDEYEIKPSLGLPLLVGGCACIVINLTSYFSEDGRSLHEATVLLSEFASEHLVYPIVIMTLLFALDKTFQKLYKFGKKVKPLVDKINQEN